MFAYSASLHEPLQHNTVEYIYSHYFLISCIESSQAGLHNPR